MEQQQQQQFNIGDKKGKYIFQRFLQSGNFSEVYLAIDPEENNREVAIKCIPLSFVEDTDYTEYLAQEIELMQQNESENCVSLIKKMRDKKNLYLVVDYCNEGTFTDYLKTYDNNRLEEDEAIQIFKGVYNGIKSLHQKGLVHRDLKFENILMHNGQPKLGHFGSIKIVQTIQGISNSLTKAPEVINGEQYSEKSDVYSLGTILYYALFGATIYDNKKEGFDLKKTINEKVEIDFNYNGVKITEYMKSFIKSMLESDQEKRISMEQVWLNLDVLEKEINKRTQISKIASKYSEGDYYDPNDNKFDDDDDEEEDK